MARKRSEKKERPPKPGKRKPYTPLVRNPSQVSQSVQSQRVRSSTPPRRGARPLGRLRRSLPFLIVVILISMFFGLAYLTMQATKAGNEAKKQTNVLYNPGFKTRYGQLGQQIVSAWYSSQTAPVPVVQSVAWPAGNGNAQSDQSTSAAASPVGELSLAGGYDTPLKAGKAQNWGVDAPNPVMEVLTYNGTFNGQPQQFTITLGIPDINNTNSSQAPILLSAPTLSSAPQNVGPSASAPNVTPSPNGSGYKSVSLSGTAQSQVTAWATAWTAGDSTTLKSLTLDSNSAHYYTGLGNNWQFTGPITVNWAATVPAADGTPNQNQVYAEISFPIGQVGPTQDGGNASASAAPTYANVQTMDVLINNYNSGLPAIQSWGPQGSYASLKPFSVAQTISSDQPSPTPSESSSGGPSLSANSSVVTNPGKASPNSTPSHSNVPKASSTSSSAPKKDEGKKK